MKKLVVLAVVFALVFSSMAFAGPLLDKEKKLIESTQTNFERSNNLRDMRPYQIALKFGPPLFLGAEISYNINPMFAVLVGAGTTAPGFAAELGLNVYILPSIVAPIVTAGIVYYTDLTSNIVALNVGAGVDVQLDNAFGLQLGFDWVKSLSDAGAPFRTLNVNGEVSWLNITAGVSYRY